ncbi:Hypothetical protein LUCI_2723 [Lucifera butyrica]|uniref:DUF370 domain-containing protein n=1 Tax=Lucifera butyrica TaxID=1351585 RepID=A0A498R7K5_9FIRM|nr:extracellular matrix/biofilm biosynthesis regulator RemA family protein [Lucifera butyrica]VBB07474.1 Hypothetical protein LUCI_2723 [Lucifera butyrica]
MFLHLGADTVIPLKNVILINDLKAVRSKTNEEFIKNMRKQNRVSDVSEGNIKSFVVTDKNVYLSAISSLTLKKRAASLPDNEIEDDE